MKISPDKYREMTTDEINSHSTLDAWHRRGRLDRQREEMLLRGPMIVNGCDRRCWSCKMFTANKGACPGSPQSRMENMPACHTDITEALERTAKRKVLQQSWCSHCGRFNPAAKVPQEGEMLSDCPGAVMAFCGDMPDEATLQKCFVEKNDIPASPRMCGRMRAITVCQPWAWAIIEGRKLVENRNWPTQYRGVLAIHAGKSMQWFTGGNLPDGTPEPVVDSLIFGAVIGTVEIYDCVRRNSAKVTGNCWAEGPWCWLLRNQQKFDRPVFCRGQQGFFEVEL